MNLLSYTKLISKLPVRNEVYIIPGQKSYTVRWTKYTYKN